MDPGLRRDDGGGTFIASEMEAFEKLIPRFLWLANHKNGSPFDVCPVGAAGNEFSFEPQRIALNGGPETGNLATSDGAKASLTALPKFIVPKYSRLLRPVNSRHSLTRKARSIPDQFYWGDGSWLILLWVF